MIGAPVPEVYTEGVGWRTLDTAGNDDAYGKKNLFYPRGFQAANGQILIIANNSGKMFYLDPAGTGKVSALAPVARPGGAQFPTLMYAAGQDPLGSYESEGRSDRCERPAAGGHPGTRHRPGALLVELRR